jgi:phosphoglucomutase
MTTKSSPLAARPSGTEDIYKIYAESFRGADQLQRIVQQAQTIVDAVLAAPGVSEQQALH